MIADITADMIWQEIRNKVISPGDWVVIEGEDIIYFHRVGTGIMHADVCQLDVDGLNASVVSNNPSIRQLIYDRRGWMMSSYTHAHKMTICSVNLENPTSFDHIAEAIGMCLDAVKQIPNPRALSFQKEE